MMDFQNQKLFDYMANEHGVTLLESELGDLIRVVNEESTPSPSTSTSWLLIIPMAVFEIFLLGVCWVVSFAHKPTGKRLVKWSIRTLPDKDWYS